MYVFLYWVAAKIKENSRFRARVRSNINEPLSENENVSATRDTIVMTKKMADAGADAALVVTPCYFKSLMSNQALEQHYTKVSQITDEQSGSGTAQHQGESNHRWAIRLWNSTTPRWVKSLMSNQALEQHYTKVSQITDEQSGSGTALHKGESNHWWVIRLWNSTTPRWVKSLMSNQALEQHYTKVSQITDEQSDSGTALHKGESNHWWAIRLWNSTTPRWVKSLMSNQALEQHYTKVSQITDEQSGSGTALHQGESNHRWAIRLWNSTTQRWVKSPMSNQALEQHYTKVSQISDEQPDSGTALHKGESHHWWATRLWNSTTPRWVKSPMSNQALEQHCTKVSQITDEQSGPGTALHQGESKSVMSNQALEQHYTKVSQITDEQSGSGTALHQGESNQWWATRVWNSTTPRWVKSVMSNQALEQHYTKVSQITDVQPGSGTALHQGESNHRCAIRLWNNTTPRWVKSPMSNQALEQHCTKVSQISDVQSGPGTALHQGESNQWWAIRPWNSTTPRWVKSLISTQALEQHYTKVSQITDEQSGSGTALHQGESNHWWAIRLWNSTTPRWVKSLMSNQALEQHYTKVSQITDEQPDSGTALHKGESNHWWATRLWNSTTQRWVKSLMSNQAPEQHYTKVGQITDEQSGSGTALHKGGWNKTYDS